MASNLDKGKPFRFKKGQVANPTGRPKGKSLTNILKKLLNDQYTIPDPNSLEAVDENGNPVTVVAKGSELINLKLIAKAMDGNTKAIDMIYDRIEGKVPLQEKEAEESPLDGGQIVIVDVNAKAKKNLSRFQQN